jgi:hypothetical protein
MRGFRAMEETQKLMVQGGKAKLHLSDSSGQAQSERSDFAAVALGPFAARVDTCGLHYRADEGDGRRARHNPRGWYGWHRAGLETQIGLGTPRSGWPECYWRLT